MVFVFVILHYNVYKDTMECVKSIIDNVVIGEHEKYNIIVVDNGSRNDSFSVLQKELVDDRIILLHNDENVGFARGNNIGFKYAKEKLKANFIALINNDTIISQKNWITKVSQLYDKYHFAVLGPDIVTADGRHQNPFYTKVWNIKSLHRVRRKQQIKMILTFLRLDKFLKEKTDCAHHQYVNHDMVDADLHGACLIFSEEYINKFDGLCDKTFLYMEEEILKLYIIAYHLHSLYSPEIKIYHKEDIATYSVSQSSRKRNILKYKYWIASSKAFEEVFYELSKRGKNECTM